MPKPRITATQVSLPSDPPFPSRVTNDSHAVWDQVMLDVRLEYAILSDRSAFAIRPGFERLGQHVVTIIRYVTPTGADRAFEFTGDPGFVALDPRWPQAALTFVRLGFLHILEGTDHLLFLLCLVIPLRRLRPLLWVVSAFTVAHSVTLIASAYDLAPQSLWFPPLIETLIAASIVWMALENIVGAKINRRWMMAFVFGLVHGFGFSFALREKLQFAGAHLLTSLTSFNIGVELGQLMVLMVLIPSLIALFRYVVAERIGTIIVSALVAHTGWHWMLDRLALLRQFQAPTMDIAFLAAASRWLLILMLIEGAAAFANSVRRTRAVGIEKSAPPIGE